MKLNFADFAAIFFVFISCASSREALHVPNMVPEIPVREPCTDNKCMNEANRILTNLDWTVDPCDDFYAFCCNGWLKKHPIFPEWTSMLYMMESEAVLTALKNLLRYMNQTAFMNMDPGLRTKGFNRMYKVCHRFAFLDFFPEVSHEQAKEWKNCVDLMLSKEMLPTLQELRKTPGFRDAEIQVNQILRHLEYTAIRMLLASEFLEEKLETDEMDELKNLQMLNVVSRLRGVDDRDKRTNLLSELLSTKVHPLQLSISFLHLMSPFYESMRPPYMNYGAIGSVLGSKIMRGLNLTGGVFNEEKGRKWLSSSEIKPLEKAKCFQDQYKSLANRSLSISQMEQAMCDSEGLKLSYVAYQEMRKKQQGVTQEILPGLQQFSPIQMFFISYGSIMCENESPRLMANQNEELIGRHRVWLSISNNEEFSKAFGCRQNQKMSPDEKCHVWFRGCLSPTCGAFTTDDFPNDIYRPYS